MLLPGFWSAMSAKINKNHTAKEFFFWYGRFSFFQFRKELETTEFSIPDVSEKEKLA